MGCVLLQLRECAFIQGLHTLQGWDLFSYNLECALIQGLHTLQGWDLFSYNFMLLFKDYTYYRGGICSLTTLCSYSRTTHTTGVGFVLLQLYALIQGLHTLQGWDLFSYNFMLLFKDYTHYRGGICSLTTLCSYSRTTHTTGVGFVLLQLYALPTHTTGVGFVLTT